MPDLQSIEDHLVRQILSRRAFEQHGSGKVSRQELAPFLNEIAAISRSYVTHSVGAALSSPIESVRSAESYALYYTPINAAKVLHLTPMMSLPESELRVLDVGSGPGTAGLALLASLCNSINLTCVEHSPPMRTVAERVLSKFSGRGTLTKLTMLHSLPPESPDTFDLIIAANVLAELDSGRGENLIVSLARRLSPAGHLMVIEPGQQRHTRQLMRLRDIVLSSERSLAPVFPCLRSDECPMLKASESDWCHGTIEWAQPRLSAHLDDLLSFNKHRIKYSAFLFQQNGRVKDGVRVLTPPEKNRLGTEALVCGKDTYGVVRIRKGQRSESNRPFEKADTFERLRLSEPCPREIAEHVVVTSMPDTP